MGRVARACARAVRGRDSAAPRRSGPATAAADPDGERRRRSGADCAEAHRDGAKWFSRAAERYRESWEHAPPGSWGRPIGAIKSLILAGDWDGAAAAARWAIESGAAESDSPIGRYAAALAYGVLGDWDEMRLHADYARTHEGFPNEVADALAYVAAEDVAGYVEAVEDVLESFAARDSYLEDVPVADTVLVLQALAARRGMAAELESELLP